MLKDHSQDVIEACSNLLKKLFSTITYSAGSIDCEFYMELQRAHRVLYRSSFGLAPVLVKEISKLASVSFAKDANRMKGPSNIDKDIDDLHNEDSNHISFLQSDALWSTVLSAFYFKKRKLSEKAFIALNNLLLFQELNLNVPTKIFMHPYTRTSEMKGTEASTSPNSVSCSVGVGVFEVLTEFLCVTSDSNLQLCILFRLQGLLNGDGQFFLEGRSITRILRSVFMVSTWTYQESIRERCQKVLKLCVLSVTRRFVKESPSAATSEEASSRTPSYSFSTTAPLDDYTTHVPPDASYMPIDVVDTSAPAWGETPRSATAPEGSSQPPPPLSYDPCRLFPVSVRALALRLSAQALRPCNKGLPAPLKGILLLLRVVCDLASQPCLGAPKESGAWLRHRQLALDLLELVLAEFPVANCVEEHPCAIKIALVLPACGFELIGCLVRNLSATTPFLLFNAALNILKLLLIKCHYHLGRELHAMMVAFLFPLVKSKHCDFRQKYAVLSMLRDLFSLPSLLISFFVNYDCNPAIGADGFNGDMVESLVDFVVEIVYLDFSPDNREGPQLSQEEKQLLRTECFTIMHIFTDSLYLWIAEDPKATISSLVMENNACCSGIDRTPNTTLAGTYPFSCEKKDSVDKFCNLSTTTDMFFTLKASYDDENLSQPHMHLMPASNVNIDSNGKYSHLEDTSQTKELIPNTATPFEESCIQYHWKHLHYQINNKCMFQKAARMVNSGKWKEAKNFLESRKCLPVQIPSEAEQQGETVSGGSSSYAAFARFLYEYPGISRDALNKIISSLNKKGNDVNLLLRDYFSLFHYREIPIDIAFRDTLCKFVSWEAPMFEIQVWETIQTIFGEAYAKENPLVITAKDAETMAGALLFLHTSLHNKNAKSVSISLDQFISASTEFLDFPPDIKSMQKIFERIKKNKWDLDMYGRTPQEVERHRRQYSIFSSFFIDQLLSQYRGGKSIQPHQFPLSTSIINLDAEVKDISNTVHTREDVSVIQCTPSADDGMERWQTQSKSEQNSIPNPPEFIAEEYEGSTDFNLQPPKTDVRIAKALLSVSESDLTFPQANDYTTNFGSSHDIDSISTTTDTNIFFSPSSFEGSSWNLSGEIDLLNSKAPAYTTHMGKPKIRRNSKAESTEASMFYLKKLEAIHMRFFSNYANYHPQPYIFPYYAEHVQPLLLLTYPKVMACIYLGFSITEVSPPRWHLLETLHRLYDIAAAFMINLSDQQAKIVETVQKYLCAKDAHQLISHTQTWLTLLLVNHI
ncbi:unnamed protein product [Phytomonas sp. Hart1]|nr:unnamed protein product [Phytomonas sp. Hart1]|eukprot:CCW67740.1 unnamed protein product [Phytomonas sp. isolate Hart1]